VLSLDSNAVAARCGIDPQYVRKLAREHRIPHYRVGARLRFDPDEVDAWLEAQHVPVDEVRL
jgi:excisionase family DNA binding protein